MRKTLPRLRLRELDAASLVDISGSFDDDRVVNYSGGTISLPTTLTKNSYHLSSDLTSSITISSTARQNAIEGWLRPQTSVGQDPAFREVGLHEQDIKDSQFFLTGTAIEEIGPGFSSDLGQKTVFRYELPVTSPYTLLESTASIQYYDFSSKTLKLAGTTENPRTNFTPLGDSRLYTPFGTPVASGGLYGNPLSPSYYHSSSNPYSTRTNDILPFSASHPWVQSNITKEVINSAYQHVMAENVNVNKQFGFETNDVAPLTFAPDEDIPFLVEKMVVEMPFEAGPGWFLDKTRSIKINQSSSKQGDYSTSYNNLDAGGPCITVGLMKETRNRPLSQYAFDITNPFYDFTVREVIIDGTVIPSGDNTQQVKAVKSTSGNNSSFYLEGFNCYSSDPSTVVTPNGSTYTGSIRVEMVPKVTNVFYYSYGNGKKSGSVGAFNPTSSYGYNQQYLDLLSTPELSSFQNLKPFGRSGLNTTAGASLFGGERTASGLTNINGNESIYVQNPWYQFQSQLSASIDLSASAGYNVSVDYLGMVKKDSISPYLLMPGDRITLFVSKHRPVKLFTTGSSYSDLYDTNYDPASIAKHDVKIPTGSIRISVYGSYVQNSSEKHINDKRKEDVVTTIIGDDPIVDQYDLSPPEENIGTYYDELNVPFSSSFPMLRFRYASAGLGLNYTDTLTFNQSNVSLRKATNPYDFYYTREAILDAPLWGGRRPTKEILGSIRVSPKQRHVSGERLFDSIPLKIDETLAVEGTLGLIYNNFMFYQLSLGKAAAAAQFEYYKWLRAFPFEDDYSSVSRQLTPYQQYKGIDYATHDSGSLPNALFLITKQFDDTQTNPVTRAGTSFFALDAPYTGPLISSFTSLSDEDTQRYFFGFGDYMSSSYDSGSGVYETHVGLPTFRYNIGSYKSGPIIRGWKYGLASALPSYSSCVFSKKHYGYHRDMLEQRQFTVFHDPKSNTPLDGPVTARFVARNNDGTFSVTDPVNTSCINLSPSAASAVPYFDGEMRDRTVDSLSIVNENMFMIPT